MNKEKQNIIVIGFILSLLINIILPSFVFFNFKMNQDYISKNLCVEKEIVESTCKGNCQLKIELKKVEKKSETPFENKSMVESEISVLYFQEVNPIVILGSGKSNQLFSQLKAKTQVGFSDIILLPPIS